MVIQGPFLHDLSTGHVDENGTVLHAVKLGGADETASGMGEGRTDYQHVGRLQELIEPFRCSDPSATIAFRGSLSSKAMTRGGRLNSMHPRLPRLHRKAELPFNRL